MNELVCPACNYANESNRVFCQNCGLRLFAKGEDTVVAELTRTQKKAEAFERRGRTVNRPMSRDELQARAEGKYQSPAARLAHLVFVTVRLVVIAAMSAVVIQMLRTPEVVPPEVPAFTKEEADKFEKKIIAARDIGDGAVFVITINDANRFLAQRVEVDSNMFSQFVRCYVAPVPSEAEPEPAETKESSEEESSESETAKTEEPPKAEPPATGPVEKPKVIPTAEGKFYLGSQQSIFGMSVYVQILFDVQGTENKGIQAHPVAASFGRLKLPSQLVPWMAERAENTTGTIGGIVESLRRAEKIVIFTDDVKVTWPEIELEDEQYRRK